MKNNFDIAERGVWWGVMDIHKNITTVFDSSYYIFLSYSIQCERFYNKAITILCQIAVIQPAQENIAFPHLYMYAPPFHPCFYRPIPTTRPRIYSLSGRHKRNLSKNIRQCIYITTYTGLLIIFLLSLRYGACRSFWCLTRSSPV